VKPANRSGSARRSREDVKAVETLTAAIDEDLVERAQEGDDAALDVLLQRYRHYARAKARSYFLAGADKEDIVQEGMIGLFKAIRDFQANRNTAFRAFAELCITRQIITAIKTATRQKHIPLNSYVSLNKPSASEDQDRPLSEALVGTSSGDPAELVISAEEISSIRESVGRLLSDLETEVLQLYMDGKSYQEIADMLGRHVKSIDNALQRIKRKLEHHIGGRAAHAT
jgi:RNA polymerase sporulation-specific sigma factor